MTEIQDMLEKNIRLERIVKVLIDLPIEKVLPMSLRWLLEVANYMKSPAEPGGA